LLVAIAACGSGPSSDDEALVGTPPGATARTPALVARLAAALHARGPEYQARTEHRTPDGRPRYTNRLILESSPYLIQHAHNPVDWYPWGDEAFERARREHKPVLLSVGYATCHWCHVMERESFEDDEIARVLNERYVAIKVDREERPDVDGVYMTAVEALTGGGGWPMTVWLTPDRQPFFGGTYFPPRDGARAGRPGFLSVLLQMADAYRDDPARVAGQATRLVDEVRQASRPPPSDALPSSAPIRAAAAELLSGFDAEWGGFGGAPKFPRSIALEFLLRYWRRTGSEAARTAVETTLDRMARGGIHDQVGGGFHRYATDRRWLVPHFEKMLSDNALLAVAYLEGWQATGRTDFAAVVRDTLDYLLRDMAAPDGGFYGATDADSAGGEGRFYVWRPDEIDAAVGPERGRLVRAYFDVTAGGNFDGASILWVPRQPGDVATGLGVAPERLASEVAASRPLLLAARARREAPLRDEKIVTGWNGLATSALARAGLALGEPRYVHAAVATARFMTTRMLSGGRLARAMTEGTAGHAGVLEDYAFVTAGLLDVFEATQDPAWLQQAIALERVVSAHFADPAGGWFETADDAEALLARAKPGEEGALPTGASVSVQNLLRLAELTEDGAWRGEAERGLASVGGLLARAPAASPRLLSALDWTLDVPKAVVLVAPAEGDAGAVLVPFIARLGAGFVPNRVLLFGTDGAGVARLATAVPIVEGKGARGPDAVAYVCEGRTCDLPTSDADIFVRQLARVTPLP
jgi:uncharacterized protein YyaL (SSP411 family)